MIPSFESYVEGASPGLFVEAGTSQGEPPRMNLRGEKHLHTLIVVLAHRACCDLGHWHEVDG